MKMIPFLFLLAFTANVKAQDTVVLRTFEYAFSVVVSDDESTFAVLLADNRIEIFDIKSLKMLSSVTVKKNAWLEKAFFDDGNKMLYYDFGMRAVSYKRIDMSTGEKEKVDCSQVPKGCSYKAAKYCGPDDTFLELKNQPYIFKRQSKYNISICKVE